MAPLIRIRRNISEHCSNSENRGIRPTAQAVSFGSTPARIWVAHALLLALQFLGAGSLDVQSARLGGAVGNLDPAATRMAPCRRGHPDHVLSAFCSCICLRCRYRSQIKIPQANIVVLPLLYKYKMLDVPSAVVVFLRVDAKSARCNL